MEVVNLLEEIALNISQIGKRLYSESEIGNLHQTDENGQKFNFE